MCPTPGKEYISSVPGRMAVWMFYLRFRKSMLFHFLYHEKQEIFNSTAKGRLTNHWNHSLNSGHNGPVKPAARRDYKDSVFRILFRDQANILSLYIYVAKEYQFLTKDQILYSSSLIRLFMPRFIVFYNSSGIGFSQTFFQNSKRRW